MNTSESDQPSLPQDISIGGVLAARRQEWGLSVQDVATRLNLGVSAIEALEADQYASLPGSTFVKGYIRSYAKLLQLDGEQMLDHIDLQPERITEIPSTRADLKLKGKTHTRSRTGAGRFFKGLIWLILIIGLVGFGLTQLPRFGITEVSDLLNFPGAGEENNENLIVIPGLAPETDSAGENSDASDRSSGQSNNVLIPID